MRQHSPGHWTSLSLARDAAQPRAQHRAALDSTGIPLSQAWLSSLNSTDMVSVLKTLLAGHGCRASGDVLGSIAIFGKGYGEATAKEQCGNVGGARNSYPSTQSAPSAPAKQSKS